MKALEEEKLKQAIEIKKMENKLKLLQLEDEVRDAEIEEMESKSDSKSSGYDYEEEDGKNDRISAWVKDIPVEAEATETGKMSEMKILCQTIADAIKTVGSSSRQDKFVSRQTIEKDFPQFDGNPGDWPTFIAQVRRISSLCEFSPDEMMIKIQRSLRGEAKYAVMGMMLSPDNIELVLQTLEMRFGRPELIIEGLIDKVKSFPIMREQNLETLIHFSSNVRCLVATIKSLKNIGHLQNPQLLKELVQKLPETLKLRWGEEIMSRHGDIDLEYFSEWIIHFATAASYVSTPKFPKTELRSKNYTTMTKKPEISYVTSDPSKISEYNHCTYCPDKGHNVNSCPKLKEDDVDIRWDTVTKRKLCFSCLKNNHQTMRCRARKVCGVDGCQRRHHRYLHKETQIAATADLPKTLPSQTACSSHVPSTSQVQSSVLAVGHGKGNILLRTIKVRLYSENDMVETVALCDEASTVSLIDNSILDKLRLKGKKESLCIQWTNNLTVTHDNSLCLNLGISGAFDDSKIFTLKGVRSIENLSLPEQIIRQKDWQTHEHLKGLPFSEIDERPMLLLGQDNIGLTVARKVIQGPENTPIAKKTSLGWILHGIDNGGQMKSNHSFHICCKDASDDYLHDLVKQSFTTESFGVSVSSKSKYCSSDERAMKIMEDTAKRDGDKFEIGLLWKEENMVLPESKKVAINRLMCVERHLERDENLKKRYCDKIRSYVEKGYAKKLTKEEASEENDRCWYLPHFGVINPNKPTKLRLVFDAAAKSHGVSLNDNLLAGPDLLQNLVGILLKFRQRKIAFCADVREMFHQVRIRQEDRDSQRFLWRDGNSKKPIEVYHMQVMTFGATCSPTSAQYIKNLNASRETNEKRVLDAIIGKHYVDDYLDCCDSEEEAVKMISEVSRIQKLGGFELVSWLSNSEMVMEALSTDEHLNKDLNLSGDSTVKILGLTWNSKTDDFCFKLKKMDEDKSLGTTRPTKRHVLRIVMSVFDPLGLVVNLTVRGRILIQDIWRSCIGWDDTIDEELHKIWNLWLKDLEKVRYLKIPRCYSTNLPQAERIELHVFCDASKKAFATAAYLRTITEETVEITLVIAKAKVAPTKELSIPRLELQAALLGSRLAKLLKEVLEFEIDKIYMWTDSTTVLYWIDGDRSNLKQFESCRVGEIQELTDKSDWQWIPSECNAADNATRSYGSEATLNFEKWISGPDYLKIKDERTWPSKTLNEIRKQNDCEKYIEFSAVTVRMDLPLPKVERFSKWLRLIRTTAWILRFKDVLLSKIRSLNIQFPVQLTVDELKKAEKMWIMWCQSESFQREINSLKNNRKLETPSRLMGLSPILNSEGILVMNGRTNLAPSMTVEAKQPIILPPRMRYTRLMLEYYPEKFAHQGVETVLNEVRQKFWIINGRSEVKSVFARCIRCRHAKTKPQIPIMGQLPVFRLTPNVRPFTYTGVDYFGPLFVSVGRRREKRWGVIFTCLSIRAVHLEVAHSLNTDSAIMTVRRMSSRRGQPKEIYSDQGTNFRGAAEELKKAMEELDNTRIADTMSVKGIEWKRIPPGSPHMGGAWERLVRSVKTTFYSILRGQVLRDELLNTLFAESEFIINSRPLTKVSVDPNDFESITPNHMLLGSSRENTNFLDISQNLRSEWRKSQQYTNWFWKRWTKEYLPTLTKRSKWNSDGKPIKKDDIVIIVEENAPRRSWKLGKVESVFPGPDGRVRVADIKTSTGVYRRPVTKLCLIEECEKNL